MQKKLVPLMALSMVVLLTACKEDPKPQTNYIRAIKSFTVADTAGGSIRSYAGKINAANSANLSFAVKGRIQTIHVQSGQEVTQGQLLASLDKEPFNLETSLAKAELEKAKSNLHEKEEELKRNQKLFKKGWVSKAALEQAETARNTTKSDVSFKETKLNQTIRDLNDSELHAPFDGIIGDKHFDANEEVQVGEKVFSINSSGTLEVQISVPEQVVPQLSIGQKSTATFSALKGVETTGRVTEIESTAGDGNVFGVKITLIDPPSALRPGMSASVGIATQSTEEKSGYLIPLGAIASGDQDNKGFVFKFDQQTGKLTKIPVTPQTVRANMIAVTGVAAGDVIASAGVSFLSDDLTVKLMQ